VGRGMSSVETAVYQAESRVLGYQRCESQDLRGFLVGWEWVLFKPRDSQVISDRDGHAVHVFLSFQGKRT